MNYKIRSKSKSPLVLITLFILFTLISCNQGKNESGQTQQSPVPPPGQEQPGTATTEPDQSVENKTEKQPLTVQNNVEVKLNPPHGQPFHRCDIPVGAPLNSAPVSTNNEAVNNQVQTTTPQSSAPAPGVANNPYAPTVENATRFKPSQARNTTTATSGSKPRLNPPHGQPFHQCEIPVGSPLPNTP